MPGGCEVPARGPWRRSVLRGFLCGLPSGYDRRAGVNASLTGRRPVLFDPDARAACPAGLRARLELPPRPAAARFRRWGRSGALCSAGFQAASNPHTGGRRGGRLAGRPSAGGVLRLGGGGRAGRYPNQARTHLRLAAARPRAQGAAALRARRVSPPPPIRIGAALRGAGLADEPPGGDAPRLGGRGRAGGFRSPARTPSAPGGCEIPALGPWRRSVFDRFTRRLPSA